LYLKEQQLSGQKMNQSAIHFTYNGNNHNDSIANFTQPLNFSTVIDKEKETLAFENKELKRSNEQLKS
jgi:hypothetical protein